MLALLERGWRPLLPMYIILEWRDLEVDVFLPIHILLLSAFSVKEEAGTLLLQSYDLQEMLHLRSG